MSPRRTAPGGIVFRWRRRRRRYFQRYLLNINCAFSCESLFPPLPTPLSSPGRATSGLPRTMARAGTNCANSSRSVREETRYTNVANLGNRARRVITASKNDEDERRWSVNPRPVRRCITYHEECGVKYAAHRDLPASSYKRISREFGKRKTENLKLEAQCVIVAP